ncbi:MAG: glycosyltransferase family 4 protein [Caenispirillum sp.]|nr:glycosyltransferase family 4 protein [Caenispirillum sp.]
MSMGARIALDVHTLGQCQTGNETYIRNLATGLFRLQRPWEIFLYHTRAVTESGLPEGTGTFRRLWPHQPLLRIPLSFPLALWRDKIDLAHFQYVAPPLCPCPTVVTVHDISYEFFPEYFPRLQRERMRMLIPLSARRAAHVLTISEFSRATMVERYGIAAERISVTYLGVAESFRRLAADQAREQCRRFGLDRPFVLGVGNLQPRKNLERLMRAFARLPRRTREDFDLVLVGQPGWQAERIQAEAERLGIAERVRFTGYVADEELVALYNLATVFAYPSLYEGFGLPVLEAMACAAPVLTSSVSSLPEVAGTAALLVDPRDEEAISAGLLKLLTDDALRESLRTAGIARAARFSWQATAQHTAEVFEKVLAGR